MDNHSGSNNVRVNEGPKGVTGNTGPTGPAGSNGSTGATGATGAAAAEKYYSEANPLFPRNCGY